MSKELYTLRLSNKNEEYHIFISEQEEKCMVETISICNKLTYDGSKTFNKYSCKTEDEMRNIVCKIGRKVCGTCVSHLYETY